MTQKKVVIKVSINDHISRFFCFSRKSSHSKALRLAAGFPGAQAVKLVRDQDQIEVIGEIDAVNLTTLLRKKLRFAEIVSVAEVKKEGEGSKDKPDEKKDAQPLFWPYPRQEIVYVPDPCPQSWCWPL